MNEPSSETAPPAASSAAKPADLTQALEKDITPDASSLTKALHTPPATAAPAKKTKAEKLAEEKAKAAEEKKQKALALAAKKAERRAQQEAATKNTPAVTAVAAEKDVSLLAAIVAHNTGVTPPKVADAGTEASPSAASASTEESADALLKRCSTLAPEQQAACRIKACAGSRASQAVCKVSQAPATPAPTAAPAAAAQAPAAAAPQ